MNSLFATLFVCLLSPLLLAQTGASKGQVLFIRGGTGTVGFFEGGSDEQGASIFNYRTNNGNHGWGELGAALIAEGFSITEMSEDQPTPKSPIPLDTLDLSPFKIIVFGSNNAEYTPAQVTALQNWVRNGGSALFIADANFGSNWADATSSDTQLLAPFGILSNQDQGTYAVPRAGGFLVPSHPIFTNVNSFDGEGVSPASLVTGFTDQTVQRVRLASVPGTRNVRRNPSPLFSGNQGSSSQNTSADGTLIVATAGAGRVAVHFDRNTFFNLNGAGTNLNRLDNEAYARNLFNWLAATPDTQIGAGNYAPRAHFPNYQPNREVAENTNLTFDVIAKDPDGTVVSVELLVDGVSQGQDTAAPYAFSDIQLSAGNRTVTARVTDNDGGVTDSSLNLSVQSAADIAVPLQRAGWILTASVNNNANDLANAIDGDLSSRWATRQFQTPGQKLTLTLPQPTFFSSIVLDSTANDEDYPRGYILRGRRSAADGLVEITRLTNVPAGPVTTITLPNPGSWRVLEIEQTGTSPNRWWSVHELNLLPPTENTALNFESYLDKVAGAARYTAGANAANFLPDADPDGDGRSNLLEYLFNQNPWVAEANPPVRLSTENPPDLDLTFRTGPAQAAVSYQVEGSSNLLPNSWSPMNLTVIRQPDSTRAADNSFEGTFRITPPTGSTNQFYRIRATAP